MDASFHSLTHTTIPIDVFVGLCFISHGLPCLLHQIISSRHSKNEKKTDSKSIYGNCIENIWSANAFVYVRGNRVCCDDDNDNKVREKNEKKNVCKRLPQNSSSGEVGQQVSSMKRIMSMVFFCFSLCYFQIEKKESCVKLTQFVGNTHDQRDRQIKPFAKWEMMQCDMENKQSTFLIFKSKFVVYFSRLASIVEALISYGINELPHFLIQEYFKKSTKNDRKRKSRFWKIENWPKNEHGERAAICPHHW